MHIAVDLDGTLAEYDRKNREQIGDPIPSMVKQIELWQEAGHTVHIFTSRVASGEIQNARAKIYGWLDAHRIRGIATITANKEKHFGVFFDDKAFHVARNTGEICPVCHSGGRESL